MRFEAPWGGTLRASSVLGSAALGIAAAALLTLAFRVGDPAAVAVASAAALALVGAVLVARALAPVGYAIEGGAVTVLRRAGPLKIPIARIRAAGPLGTFLGRTVRLGGSGGLFGFYGGYWSRPLGYFRLQATRTDRLVELDTPDGRFVLSPEPPDRFLEEVLARAPAARLVPAEGPHERHAVPRRAWIRLAALIFAGPAVVAAVVIASFGYAPEGARVDRWNVTVVRRWAKPVEIPIASVRSVEILERSTIGRVSKVYGFTDGRGRAWGRFRSGPLGTFDLYSWGRGPWVRLDTDDGRIVLTPEDPERFVAEVRAAMALHASRSPSSAPASAGRSSLSGGAPDRAGRGRLAAAPLRRAA